VLKDEMGKSKVKSTPPADLTEMLTWYPFSNYIGLGLKNGKLASLPFFKHFVTKSVISESLTEELDFCLETHD
jgi:hypothetical protein